MYDHELLTEISDWGQTFPCNDRMDELNKIFIIRPFHYGPEPAIKLDNLKKTRHFGELYTWPRDTVMWHWSVDTLFDSCQLTITWMSRRMLAWVSRVSGGRPNTQAIRISTIKFSTDLICLAQPTRNAQPNLQENNAYLAANQRMHTIAAIIYYNSSRFKQSLKWKLESKCGTVVRAPI